MKATLPFLQTSPAARARTPGLRRRSRRGLWLGGALLGLLVLAAGIYWWRTQQPAGAAPTTLPVPVLKGDLDTYVESSGSVEPARTLPVKYATGGTVTDVLVQPGDKVTAGQPLARLNDQDLRLALDQAEANLKSAQAKRAQLDDGPSAADRAEADANVTKAAATLATVQAGATAHELAEAQAAVHAAQLKLDQVKAGATATDLAGAMATINAAQAQLDKVKAGATAHEIAEAAANVAAAQRTLDDVQAGATAEELAEGQAAVDAAQLKLQVLHDGPTAADVQAAQASLTAAQARLQALLAGPTEAERRAKDLAVSQAESTLAAIRDADSAEKSQAEITLDQTANALRNAQDKYTQTANGLLNDDGSLKDGLQQFQIDAYNAALRAMQDAEGTYHKAQQALDDARKKEIRDVAGAQATLDDARQQQQELLAPPTAADRADAEAGVANAQKALDTLIAPASAADLADAESALLKARNALADLKAKPTAAELASAQDTLLKAQNTLADLKAPPSATDLADAQNTLLKAQNALADLKAKPSAADLADAQNTLLKAQNALADLKAKPTTTDLAAAQSALAAAQSSREKLIAPPTTGDIATADAAVVQAQVARDKARHDLDQATLTAPFSGTVATVSSVAGSTVGAGTEAVALNDEAGLHLDVKLSESDVTQVQKDQPVNLTFDAIPNQTITGTVTSIATAADNSSGVVTYLVQVHFDPGTLPVKVGMSANASIRVAHHAGVLQVPNRAIHTTGPLKTIEVLYGKDKTPVTVQVTIGATNGQMTEITGCVQTGNQCLREGDTVAMTLPSSATGNDPSSPGGNVMTFGAGPVDGKGAGGGPNFVIKTGPGP
jgi:HlyD family secretion protein